MTVITNQNRTGILIRAERRRKVAATGDSNIAGAVVGGSTYWQAVRTGTFCNVGNFSVAGARTDQITAQIPQAAAAGAGVVVVGGGVNDIVQAIAESTLRANVMTNFNAAWSNGMEVIDYGLPPTNTSANVPRYVQHEIWRKLYCYKNDIPHVDIWPALATSAGAFASGLNADAVHPNSVGAIACKSALLSLIQNSNVRTAPLLAMTDTASDGATFIGNAVSFTDGDTSGMPDGWFTGGVAGGTYTIEAGGDDDFGNWFRCAMSGATGVGFNPTAATLSSLGWSIGDRIAVGFRIRWADTSQALAVSAIINGVTVTGSQPLFDEKGGETGNELTVYSEMVIASGTSINLRFQATGTGYFEVNRPIVVNLTLLGLA